ncbi:CAP domain-containing protein [Sabulilitoribacter arenilitoris]|uniref:CAP domain-containing protein n=1 Tax=Wocania arenilitoris TaxID=2044858 RepID=A0AAE3EL55_9FLAO|nr:CAP domain-containing protein [Wocania arenilitoris]MCF7567328.1 CAP domain-containing protein [Wocania arenilitoris]
MKTYYYKACFIFLWFTVLSCIVSCSKEDSLEDIEKLESLSVSEEILELLNVHRASIGEDPLAKNDLATQLAEEHTRYMIAQNDISHDNFNERSDRLFNEENATRTGENVAYGQQSAKYVMEAWINSSSHRTNIEGDFTHIGIAAIKNSSGVYYFTQIFLKKKTETNI